MVTSGRKPNQFYSSGWTWLPLALAVVKLQCRQVWLPCGMIQPFFLSNLTSLSIAGHSSFISSPT